MTQLDRAFARREVGSVRWSLIVGTAMASILIGGLLIVTSPPPVPESITIRTDGSLGTFTATGDAVDSARICAEGAFFEQSPDSPPRRFERILLESRLVCPDGGADFTIRAEVEKGIWQVVTGNTGADIEGEGRFYPWKRWFGDIESDRTAIYIGEVTLTP